MTNLTLEVLLFPLLGFIILGLAGRFMSRTAILTMHASLDIYQQSCCR